MLTSLVQDLKVRARTQKGMDKPIFIIASITLAILFLVAYYTATTGWMENIGSQFVDKVNGIKPKIE